MRKGKEFTNNQLWHKCGWEMWNVTVDAWSNGTIICTSGMRERHMHGHAFLCVCVCVCARACACAWQKKSTWILWNAISVKSAGCTYQQSICSYTYAPRHWTVSGDHQVTTTGTWNYWKFWDHIKTKSVPRTAYQKILSLKLLHSTQI